MTTRCARIELGRNRIKCATNASRTSRAASSFAVSRRVFAPYCLTIRRGTDGGSSATIAANRVGGGGGNSSHLGTQTYYSRKARNSYFYRDGQTDGQV